MTVEEVANELEKKGKKFLAEPWMAHIRQLEKKVTELTDQLSQHHELVAELGKKIQTLEDTRISDLETHMADCERMINVHGQKIQALETKPVVKPLPKKDLTAKR